MKNMIDKPYVMIKQVFKQMEKENRAKRLKAPSYKNKGVR